MKFLKLGPLAPQKPKEKTRILSSLEPGDAFRLDDGGKTTFEDAMKTPGQSFLIVTNASGPKPAENRVRCITADFKLTRELDGDRSVIEHELHLAFKEAELEPEEVIEDQSDKV